MIEIKDSAEISPNMSLLSALRTPTRINLRDAHFHRQSTSAEDPYASIIMRSINKHATISFA